MCADLKEMASLFIYLNNIYINICRYFITISIYSSFLLNFVLKFAKKHGKKGK